MSIERLFAFVCGCGERLEIDALDLHEAELLAEVSHDWLIEKGKETHTCKRCRGGGEAD